MCVTHVLPPRKGNYDPNAEYKDGNGGLQLLQHTKNITHHIQYDDGEVFVVPRRIWWVGKKGSNAPSSQITMMLYQKALTDALAGAVYQRLA